MKTKSVFLISFLLLLCFVFEPDSPLCASQNESDPLCGPKSLLAVFKQVGINTDLEEVKKLSGYDKVKGTTMYGLFKTAESKGLHAVGMKISVDELSKLKIPIIVYLWGNHFQAIDKFEQNRIRIIDHEEESSWITKDDFADNYSGFALLISKDKQYFPNIKTTAPDIRFDDYVYDFSGIRDKKGGGINHVFKFRNA